MTAMLPSGLYSHDIKTDNLLCQQLLPVLPIEAVLYPFQLEILNWGLPHWEAEFKMDGVEHTVESDGSIIADLPRSFWTY
jgi:hypothetical protein